MKPAPLQEIAEKYQKLEKLLKGAIYLLKAASPPDSSEAKKVWLSTREKFFILTSTEDL